VASLAEALTLARETYQPAFPSGGAAETFREGGTESILICPMVVAIFPALSVALAERVYVPSEEAVKVLPPPLMPTEAMPDVASVAETEALTGPEVNQPFEPFGAGMLRFREGATLSTFIEAEAIVDVSP
jgi:hypothetical protein